jgi:ankyrin repeat protein
VDAQTGEDLISAAKAGNFHRVRDLLAQGADPNYVSGNVGEETDMCALGIASAAGYYSVAELLLDNGANPNPPEGKGGCPLTAAMLGEHTEIVNLLYRYGGKARLMLGFCFTNNYAAISEILHRQPARWPEYAIDSIRSGNVDMLADNLSRNPSIDPELNGAVFLSSAIVQWRLMHRYNRSGASSEPFDRTRYQTMLRMLLDWGVDPNIRHKKGETPLHIAARAGRDWSPTDSERVAHARILLDYGADVNARDLDAGTTPLHWAELYNRDPLAAFLRNRGGL